MPNCPSLIRLVLFGTYIESMTARHKLGSGTPSVRSFELTPTGIGDQFLLNALVELELIEDFEALYVVQDQDGNSARGFDFSGRAVSRQFRFQPTEQAMEEFVDMPAIEAALTSEMSSVDKRELFQLCLLLGAWGLGPFGLRRRIDSSNGPESRPKMECK